jgi:hypothetical protein
MARQVFPQAAYPLGLAAFFVIAFAECGSITPPSTKIYVANNAKITCHMGVIVCKGFAYADGRWGHQDAREIRPWATTPVAGS